MAESLEQIIGRYQPDTPLTHASTIPAAWYVDPRVFELEQRAVFRRAWQVAARVDDVREPGEVQHLRVARR